jgi:NTE family protein
MTAAALAPTVPVAPRLALVIGSGGVRSIAGLGLVDVMARHGVRPDLIVGCSAGALFGALIAMGHSGRDAVEIATRLWSPEITRRRRWRAVPQMVWPRLFGFGADFALRCDRPVMKRLHAAFGDIRFEELRVPLRVTATDADTGDLVVLERGRLVDALRASIALPFMFACQRLEGRRLVDGFLSDPLPVGAAADAQRIVALGFDAPMPRRVDVPSRMLAQVTSAMTNNLMRARLAAAEANGPPLVPVFPRLERRIGLFDTHEMHYLVEQGQRAAEERMTAILGLFAGRTSRRVA